MATTSSGCPMYLSSGMVRYCNAKIARPISAYSTMPFRRYALCSRYFRWASSSPTIGVSPMDIPMPKMKRMNMTVPPNATAASGTAPSRPTMALSAICTMTCPIWEKITGTASESVLEYCALYLLKFIRPQK